MNVALSSALVLALFVVIAAPGLIAFSRPRAGVVAVPLYVALFIGLTAYHGGIPAGGEGAAAMKLARPTATAPTAGGAPAGLCNQALAQAEEGGLVLDRSDPRRITVAKELWAQLPPEARQALVACVEASRPRDPGAAPIEVREVSRE